MGNQSTCLIRWSKVICKEPGNYVSWPTIARTQDGELLVVFSGDREQHVCPYGKDQIVRSSDGGLTWTPPEIINNTPLDDRDAGIIVLRSGTIVTSWFTRGPRHNIEQYRKQYPGYVIDGWLRHYRKIQEEDLQQWLGNWTRRSTDGGHTWEPAVYSIASASHGPIELRDGRLLFVGHAFKDNRSRTFATALLAVESGDEGRSWRQIGSIPLPPGDDPENVSLEEPHCVELPDGRLICLWRAELIGRTEDMRFLYQCESDDGGKTWTAPRPTPMWGYPPHLIRLHNGDLLATYGHRRPAYGQRACLSHDGGRTWDIEREIVLRDDASNGDLGYPASVELEPGELITVYYQIDRPGEKPSIMATRWSLHG